MTNTENVPASELREGDMLPGIGNAYVFEVEENDGYLVYPSTSGGSYSAMPDNTILVGFHDAAGEENYMLLSPDCMVTRNA